MKEIPIILTSQEVNGVREGRKTQTRRVVKLVDTLPDGRGLKAIKKPASQTCLPLVDGKFQYSPYGGAPYEPYPSVSEFCPFGQPGDRLWVRETWCVGNPFDNISPSNLPGLNDGTRWAVDYAANPKRVWHQDYQGKWRPSIHMPRWASRITLEITAVRVERLQDISDFDAFQEGAPSKAGTITGPYCMSYKEGFRALWQSIHGHGSWEANPWVWVLEFKRVEEQV